MTDNAITAMQTGRSEIMNFVKSIEITLFMEEADEKRNRGYHYHFLFAGFNTWSVRIQPGNDQ